MIVEIGIPRAEAELVIEIWAESRTRAQVRETESVKERRRAVKKP